MRRVKAIACVLALVLMFTGCASMTPTEQKVLSGGAIGAGSGAAIGAIAGGSPGIGAAVGGAAGALGGFLLDQYEKRRY